MLQLDPPKPGKGSLEPPETWADFPRLLRAFVSRQQVGGGGGALVRMGAGAAMGDQGVPTQPRIL